MNDRDSLIAFYKQIKQRDWEILPQNIKDAILKFVDIAVKNNMTNEEVLACVKFLPAEYAEIVLDALPEKEYKDIDDDLVKLYADDFVNSCDKAKDGKIKLFTTSAYRQTLKNKKQVRYITYYELFMILNGLRISVLDLMKDVETDNKYFLKIKELYNERKNVKYRNAEYKMLCDLREELLNRCLELQDKLLQNRAINNL